MRTLAGQYSPVEDADRRRSRPDGDEDGPLLGGRTPGFFPTDRVIRSARPTDGFDRCERPARLGQVEHGGRCAGNLADGLEDLRPEPVEVVDRGGGGEHRVDGSLNVPLSERASTFRIDVRGSVELFAELADLVIRRLEEPGRVAVRRKVAKRPRCCNRRGEDPPINVGQEPQKTGEDERDENHERRGRRIAGALQAPLRNRLTSGETVLELEKNVAHLRSGRQDDVVSFLP